MFFERFISIILKKKLEKAIRDDEGVALNVNKKITHKLFDNWKRNPVENLRSIQSEDSERTQSEIKKPTLKRKMLIIEEGSDEVDMQTIALSRKNKGKKKMLEPKAVTQIEEEPQGSTISKGPQLCSEDDHGKGNTSFQRTLF